MTKQAKEPTEQFNLSERAILVNLSIGRWYARKKDGEVTAEVIDRHDMDKDAGNWRKNLLPIDAPKFKKILSIANETRVFHRINTLPWSDTGMRMLPNANSDHYNDGMKVRDFEFCKAVDEFIPEFFRPGGYRDQAATKLNGTFRAADYPQTEDEMRAYFSFVVNPYPLPEVGDLRVKLTEPQVAAIRKRVEKTLNDARVGVMREAWQRLASLVHHAGEIFSQEGARVTRALFENLTAQCDLLTRLNPTDDKNFAKMTKQVKDEIASLDRHEIRKDKDARQAAADKVAEIEKRMAGFMRGVQS